jgi:hypothetical protein
MIQLTSQRVNYEQNMKQKKAKNISNTFLFLVKQILSMKFILVIFLLL